MDREKLKSLIKVSIGRYLKTYFGKGPEKIDVYFEHQKITVELFRVLNKAEKQVLEISEVELIIKEYRISLFKSLCQKINPIESLIEPPIKDVNIEFSTSMDKYALTIYLETDLEGTFFGKIK
jgi:uncharacterized protein YbcI